MKPKINLLGFCCIGIILLIGLTGCGEDAVEEDPVEFVQAIPATGSEIQPDATIVAVFNAPPSGVDVNVPNGVTFSPSGTTVTITGGFTPGPLTLVLTWASGATTLTYTVESDAPIEPDGPSPEEQLAGVYNLIQLDYDRNRGLDDWALAWVREDWGHEFPLEPPIAFGTLTMFAEDDFYIECTVKWNNSPNRDILWVRADKWDASTTNIFLPDTDFSPDSSITYIWQGATRTTLVMKLRLSRDDAVHWPLRGLILVWKKKT